jgi:carboxyl-terminal processing protease
MVGTSGALASAVEPPANIPFSDLRALTETFGKIKENYVEEVEDGALLRGAIKGMLDALDPHSVYLSPEEFSDLQAGTRGEFGGLGIEIGMEDGFVKVIAPIDGTPAQRAGIQAGDLIIRLDDAPVKGMGLQEAVSIMRGVPGTEITLTVVRQGEERPLKITLTRDVIRVQSVRSRLLDERFGYLRITQFQSRTAQNMLEALDRLQKEAKPGMQGLILDLRNNPGGVLNAAVEVADAFLSSGLIVYTQGRYAESQMRFSATPEDKLSGAPIVVLVNAGSASASEIVAGALQDQRRAVVMGERTFGKGSVQTIIPLSGGAAIKMTTARYYTPSGRSIQAEGIEPDIALQSVQLLPKADERDRFIKEADLPRHLENGKSGAGRNEEKDRDERQNRSDKKEDQNETDRDSVSSGASDPLSDYAVHEALNLLKGLVILKAQ